MRDESRKIALGGVLAAAALVVMTMGGLIPVATYICPMLCMVLLFIVTKLCRKRIAWAWYGAVAILTLLIGPDKEAGAVFLVMGYYPIIKPILDYIQLGWIIKILLFNGVTFLMYTVLLFVIGMEQLVLEFSELGTLGLLITLALGNLCFFLLDKLLSILQNKKISYRRRMR